MQGSERIIRSSKRNLDLRCPDRALGKQLIALREMPQHKSSAVATAKGDKCEREVVSFLVNLRRFTDTILPWHDPRAPNDRAVRSSAMQCRVPRCTCTRKDPEPFLASHAMRKSSSTDYAAGEPKMFRAWIDRKGGQVGERHRAGQQAFSEPRPARCRRRFNLCSSTCSSSIAIMMAA